MAFLHIVVLMIKSIDIPQEIFANDMLTALNSPLKDRYKHVMQLLRLYGDRALFYVRTVFLNLLINKPSKSGDNKTRRAEEGLKSRLINHADIIITGCLLP